MRTVTISEFAASMEEFLRAVQAGETLTLESDEGEVLARVSPADGAEDALDQNSLPPAEAIQELIKRLPPQPDSSFRMATRPISEFLDLVGRGTVSSKVFLKALEEDRADREFLRRL